MFWNSVVAGLGVLAHGRIWLGIFLLLAAQFVFLVVTLSIFARGESGGRMAAGCLFHAVGGPLFQGFIMSVFVGFYLPMMLGSNEVTSGDVILGYLWPLAKAGFVAVIALVILCIIPVLGGLIGESPGIQNFILGVIIFRLLVGPVLAEATNRLSITSSIYPDLWSTIGYLIIAGVLVRIILVVGAFVSSIGKTRNESEAGQAASGLLETILMTLAPSFGVIGGLLPLFMYAQHIRLVLRAAVER